jgi:hypothetical protein
MPNYVMRNIAGDHVLVKTRNSDFGNTNVFVFNDTGAFLWQNLSEKKSRAQLVSLLVDQYGIGEAPAESDVDQFLKKCMAEGFVAEVKEGI